MICMRGVNEILLIKHFLVDLLHMRFCIWSFLSLSQLSVALELHCKSKALLAGLLTKTDRLESALSQSGPKCPRPALLLAQYTLYPARGGISMRSTELCFSKGGIWLQDWLREGRAIDYTCGFCSLAWGCAGCLPGLPESIQLFVIVKTLKMAKCMCGKVHGPLNSVQIPVFCWTGWIFICWSTLTV